MSIKKVAFLSYLFCLCGFILLMGVTSSHAENLYVNGSARVEWYSWPSTGEGLELAYNPYENTGYIQVYDRNSSSWGNLYLGNGEVGIGTRFPSSKLHVKSGAIGIKAESTTKSAIECIGYHKGILAKNTSSGGVAVHGIAMYTGNSINYGGFFYAKGTYGRGIFAHGGPLGYAGEFDGRIKTTSVEITNGADLSENFEIQQMKENLLPSPGMVVSIDPENPGALAVSKKAYDRKVAGVISGAGGLNPGMLMGQKDSKADGAFPVALTGRVYCYVDASYGCIEPGDLLTTSETPGYAMKAADHTKAQGTILGKAMTELKDGKGLVLTLINLQ